MQTRSTEEKKARLESARSALKSKFFGIDSIIDQVIEGINSWYHFPEYQFRPLIINLWGMTGVGKSDLVKSLISLLDLEAEFFAFDCGELSGRNVSLVRNVLAPLNEFKPSTAQILFFDEFQLMRSISETGNELAHENSRSVWQLLDTGKIQLHQDWYLVNERIFMIYRELDFYVKQGLEIADGMVAESEADFLIAKYPDKFRDLTSAEWSEFISKSKNRMALNSNELNDIFELPNFRMLTRAELDLKIKKLNGQELLALLKQEIELYYKPSQLNLSNAVIFIAGNLDEVYHFSTSQSPDISPEYYHAKSLEITIQDVKKALLKRFRVEQVARLGNLHLIYPSLNSEAYVSIIAQELDQIQAWTFERTGIHFGFSKRVKEWIYREGVAPTQGVRPLKSSIRYAVEDKISQILADANVLSEKVEKIELDYEAGTLLVSFSKQECLVTEKMYPVVEKIAPLRKATKDEKQALTAVHESGHAVAHMALFHQVPDLVLSVAAESGSMGMVVVPSIEILNFEKMKSRAVVSLAGQEAERLVFGEDLLSAGSYGDIEQATAMVIGLLKESGFGGSSMRYANSVGEYSDTYHDTKDIENLAKSILEEAKERAQEVVRNEKTLLLQMAAILSEHPSLSSQELTALVKQYGSESLKEGMNQKDPSYKGILDRQVKELETQKNWVCGKN